ncbi:hypothetical protein BGZ94_009051 [Podila epigama]|nr:hypothetical protein BGZ94_009051 [Podila epigama]
MSLATSKSETTSSTMSLASSAGTNIFEGPTQQGIDFRPLSAIVGVSDSDINGVNNDNGGGGGGNSTILADWHFSESPLPYTPPSARAMDSRSSFASTILTPLSATSGGDGTSSLSLSTMMTRSDSSKLDYLTFKPVRTQLPSLSQQTKTAAHLEKPLEPGCRSTVEENDGSTALETICGSEQLYGSNTV